MSDAWLALGAGAIAGALSIPHCVAMCGPLAAFAGGERSAPWRIGRYQLGRLGAYALLGALAGSSSGALATFVAPRWAAVALAILLAAAMLLAAARLLRRPGGTGLVQLRRSKPGVPWIARVLALAPREPSIVGALTALLPCGALYTAVLIAAGTGRWHAGALAMSAFALASGVGLASSAFFGQRARVSTRGRHLLAAALIIGAIVVVLRPILASEEPPACHDVSAAHS